MTRLLYFTLLLLVGQLCFAQDFDGFVLYNSQNQNTTYLIDKNGDIAHTWSLNRPCNYAVLMMDSGNIMRGAVKSGNAINGPAVGGLVQEFDPQGELVWEFEYSSNIYVMHHDITLMPNGNVLLTAWEVKNSAELQALGYTGNGNEKYPTHFIEVSQIDGTTDGEIVWEWHMIDHLVQDVDETKPSYGVISENPQLMDINVPVQGGGGPGGGGGDWFHVNGVDYNEDLDIITFSSRYLSEVFIIDHSTTSEEAASHEGGNFGMGGDLLYRWGNPENYEMAPDQKIYGPVHDARFITDDGRPRGGFLQFFNNEGVGNGSIVNAIELPYNDDKNGFLRDAGSAFGPADAAFTHECFSNADGQSASNSMSNGNESKGQTGVLPPPYQLKAANSEEEATEEVAAAEPTQLMATGAAEDSGGNDDSSPSSNANNNNNNNTGLPDNLKSGIENMSGLSMNDVNVHYNSPKPSQLNAHAYAQGTDIHLGKGQEKHLPHEAWHVVQQKQGRVKPTMQMKGVNVNDSIGLEREATSMGEKAVKYQPTSGSDSGSAVTDKGISGPSIAQMAFNFGEGWTAVMGSSITSYLNLSTPQSALDARQTELDRKLAELTGKIVTFKGHNYYKHLSQFESPEKKAEFAEHKLKVVPLDNFAKKWNQDGEEAEKLDYGTAPTIENKLIAHIATADEIIGGYSHFLPDAKKQTIDESTKIADISDRLSKLSAAGQIGEELPHKGKDGTNKRKNRLKDNLPSSSETSLVGSDTINTITSATEDFEEDFAGAKTKVKKKQAAKDKASSDATKEKEELEADTARRESISKIIGKEYLARWETQLGDLGLVEKASALKGTLNSDHFYTLMKKSNVKSALDIDKFALLKNGMKEVFPSLINSLSEGQDVGFLLDIYNNAGGTDADLSQLESIITKVGSAESSALKQLTRFFSLDEITQLQGLDEDALRKTKTLLTQDGITIEGLSSLLASPAAGKAVSLLEKIPNTTELLKLANAAGSLTEVDILIKDVLNNPTALAAAKSISNNAGADMAAINADNDVAVARGLKTNAGAQIDTVAPSSFSKEEWTSIEATLKYVQGNGSKPKLKHDGGLAKFDFPWENREGNCPGVRHQGGYKEHYVQRDPNPLVPYTPETKHGKRRLVRNDVTGHIYYSNDHHTSLKRLLV